MSKTPEGVVAILVANDGREVASVTDFNRGSPAGFTQIKAQEIRAREALARKTMTVLSSPLLSDSICQYYADRILQAMCESGCQVIVVPVGYDQAAAGEE